MSSELRLRVLSLYKTLLFTGRDYPKGYDYFRTRCNAVFKKNKNIKDPQKIEELVKQGEFVIKELKSLYYLRKYRTLKRRYYSEEEDKMRLQTIELYDKLSKK